MSDFFDADEVVKSYDSKIIKRIFLYIKPYKSLLLWTILSLIVSTAGELLTPIITQKTVDEALVVSWLAFDESLQNEKAFIELNVDKNAPRAFGKIFVMEVDAAKLSNKWRTEYINNNLLYSEPMYVCKLNENVKISEKIKTDLSNDFKNGPALDNGYFVSPLKYVRSLNADEALLLRANDKHLVTILGIALAIALVIILISSFVQAWTTNLIGQNVMMSLRSELFKKTTSQSLSFLSRQPVGRLVTRMTSDVESINEFFSSVVVSFVKDASLMTGAIVVLFLLNAKLALITILTLPPVIIASEISRRKARDAFRRQRTWLSKVNAYLSEHISGVLVVKLFSREKARAKTFEEHDQELMKANLSEMYVFATFRPVLEFLASVSTAVILWYGAGLHSNGHITLGTLIAFINLIRMFYSPLQDISEKFTILQNAMACGERVFKLLDIDETIKDNGTVHINSHNNITNTKGKIEFDHVWFAYKNEDWVIKDLTFTVEPGQSVAIVGYTGAGKTTVSALLARLWEPQKGQIRLDGIPITDIPLSELRTSLRSVMQEVFLFSGTISYNIDLGLGLEQKQIEAAAKSVMADEFIQRLPNAYNTVLGEGATNLSSGLRQLLSFARVVAHNPNVIVLDEATSSVDTETEHYLQLGLQEIMKNRTTIAIAHRLSTIRYADNIIVMSNGRLVEEGKHEELMQKNGLYNKLYNLQLEK